jgi:hemoglobin
MSDRADTAQARRAAITSQIQAQTGIDEGMIERLVRGFYFRIREDAIPRTIFAAKIEDWEPHLQKMFAFWSSVALMSGRYHGQPMARHLPLRIDARHFDRWLGLCSRRRHLKSVRKRQQNASFCCLCRIAESLELGLASSQGVMLKKGERISVGSRHVEGT